MILDNRKMSRTPDELDYQSFVRVADDDDGSNSFMELPKEEDGSLLLTTVTGQFPGAVGLKYRSSSGAWRGIRISADILDPPSNGWGDTLYHVTYPHITNNAPKRKAEAVDNSKSAKVAKQESLQDVIVFGLPFKCTNEDLKEYFTSKCGELAFYEVKVDRATARPRGFGFIRFKTSDGQRKALDNVHVMMGRTLEVRLSKKKKVPMKLFIGRMPKGVGKEDLREHYSAFGEIEDTFVPTPFRGFGFVTFACSEEARIALRMEHSIKGVRVNTTIADPKEKKQTSADGERGRDPISDNRGSKDYGSSRGSRDVRDRSLHDSRPRDERSHHHGGESLHSVRERDDRGARGGMNLENLDRTLMDLLKMATGNIPNMSDMRGSRDGSSGSGMRNGLRERGGRDNVNDRVNRDRSKGRPDNREPNNREERGTRNSNGGGEQRGNRDNGGHRDHRGEHDSRGHRKDSSRGQRDHHNEETSRNVRESRMSKESRDTRGPRDFRDPVERNPLERNNIERNDFRLPQGFNLGEHGPSSRAPPSNREGDISLNQHHVRDQREFRDTYPKDNRGREISGTSSESRVNDRNDKIHSNYDTRGSSRGGHDRNNTNDMRQPPTGIPYHGDPRTQFQLSNELPQNRVNSQFALPIMQPLVPANPVPPVGVPPDVANELKNMIFQFLGNAK